MTDIKLVESINPVQVNNEPQTLDELFALHATPGSVLEPDLDLPPIVFSEDNQQAVKKLNVSVISGLSSSEQYQHQMITETRKI